MSRHFDNPYPAYSSQSTVFQEGGKLPKSTESRIHDLTKNLWEEIDQNLSSIIAHSGENSIYTGYTGIALAYFLLGKKKSNRSLLKKAETICEKALHNLKKRRASFLNGDAGPLALSAAVYHENGNQEKVSSLISQLVKMSAQIATDDSIPDEILYGRSGYLYSLLFVNKHIPGSPIADSKIKEIVSAILLSGQKTAKNMKSSTPLLYEWHDKVYLGAAHGIAGILYLLLCAKDYLTDGDLKNLVRPTLDWLLKFKFESFNFQSSVESKSDRLVQWCHGAPGFIHLLVLANEVFQEEKYLELAFLSSDVVWSRGLTRKGYSICHGVAGNAYSFLRLYKVNKDDVQLYRAHCFLDWCSKYPENEEMKPDRPFSLYEGMAGLAYFLEDAMDPSTATFPAYELI